MDMLDGETEVRDYSLERLMMLSDGVFAIAMTLLALELRPPEHWDGGFDSLIEGMAAPFFAFFWSFLSIGIIWASHRQSFGRFRRADFGLTLYTLILLALVTLIPATTRIMTLGHYSRALVWLYIGLFQLIGLVHALLWCHAAFFTTIVKPGMSLTLRIAVALIVLIAAPLMTALGVLASDPATRWTPLLIPVVAFATGYGRRWAERAGRPPPAQVAPARKAAAVRKPAPRRR